MANHYITRVNRSADTGAPVAAVVVDRATHMRCNLRRVERALAQAMPAGSGMTPVQRTAYAALTGQIETFGRSIAADPDDRQWRAFITATFAMHARAKALPLAGRGYVVWDKPLWDSLHPADMPQVDTPALKRIAVRAVGNEYESACVTVSNVSGIPLALRVEPPLLFDVTSGVTAPPVGPYIDRVNGPAVPSVADGPGGWVTLRQVAFAETGTGMHGDVLPELGEASLLIVPPMSTGQLWLTIRTKDVPAGNYTATLRMKPVRTATFQPSEVKIDLTVLPTRLTGTARIRSTGFSYPRFTEIVGHDQTAVRDQLDHLMDAFVVETWLCNMGGVFDAEGRVVTPMKFDKLDRYLDLYKQGQMLLLYNSGIPSVAVQGPDGVKQLTSPDTPGWKPAFRSWYKGLVEHLLSRGLTYDQFAFFPIDEPWTPETGAEYVSVVKVAKQADAKAKTFVTAPGVPLERLKTWVPYTDIFCLGGPAEDAKALPLQRLGSEVWCYGGGGGKSDHPIGVARRLFWRAFHLGLTGQGLWDYCCSGWQKTGEETAWTELDTGARGDASMIYRGKHGPVTSKRWEGWRDGVEDHWLLTILAEAHRQGRTKIDPAAMVAAALKREGKRSAGQVDIDPLEMALHADTDPSDHKQILAARKLLLDAVAGLGAD